MSTSRRLPRGRNALPLEEVARLQSERLCSAMAEVMTEKGYVATSVEDVLKRAGVSRLSFYRLFDSKLDCFMAALKRSSGLLTERVTAEIEAIGMDGDPLERYERAVAAYFEGIEAEWPSTHICLVEAFAAGPRALSHRREMQSMMVDLHVGMLGVTDERGLLACRMVVAALQTLVTIPVAENDRETLRAVGPQMVAHVRSLWNSGAFGEGTGPA